MDPVHEHFLNINRRHFLSRASLGIGGMALASLLPGCIDNGGPAASPDFSQGIMDALHFAPKAKRVIYLFQSGGPSQFELFDYNPMLEKMVGEDLPESVRQGQRLTGMTSGQSSFPLAPSKYAFKQHGQSGAWMSELLPYTSQIADELCVIKSMHTDRKSVV